SIHSHLLSSASLNSTNHTSIPRPLLSIRQVCHCIGIRRNKFTSGFSLIHN
ncbi:hypothetical protein QTG54_011664, partial [Skeletonema marinoi]